MNILITGQCSLHWGRMEFGNIGNYYIIEPFVRELHRVFPECEISTTFQMTDEFCERENITCLPMNMYYSWTEKDLPLALEELAIATLFADYGLMQATTPYIDAVVGSDLVIDFSGDIWGDNANLVGPDRFLIGLLKDRVAQLLGKKTVMLAGSPGPFKDQQYTGLAKEVFAGFDIVTNRESISIDLLKEGGFSIENVVSLSCPAFLFEPMRDSDMAEIYEQEGLLKRDRPIVGFILCGWNMLDGPYDKWPREDCEYDQFIEAIEYMINELGVDVCFMSHSNGFKLPPNYKLIHGRDYPPAEQMHNIMTDRGYGENTFLIRGLYNPAETKSIIRQFDMLVSGRIHAAVAALSQCVPTVIIDYGHEPKAHKLRGFAQEAGVLDFVADPADSKDLIDKISTAWNAKEEYIANLKQVIPQVKSKARRNFDLLSQLWSK